MNIKSKISALLIALAMVFASFSFTAFAAEKTNESYAEYDANTSGDDIIYDDPGSSEVTPDPEPAPVEPDPQPDPQPDPGSSSITDTPSSYPEYDPGYESSSSSDYGDYSDYGNSSNYYDDYNSYSSNYAYGYNDDSSNDNYISYETPTKPVNNSSYYDSGKIDDSELSENDWNAIAQSLQNSDDSNTGDDFNFIKNNTSTSDNGLWMLVTGAVLIVLAVSGIAYTIISGINRKKKFAYASPGTGNRRASAQQNRSRNDYGDNYYNRSQRQLPKRRKIEDTADIVLPQNRNSGNHYRH
ncbi:MAG: hypothetical protein SOZ45_05565 [Ruminococcus sp.]|nr:hypothetical protein [Ruminococcus sp.]